MQRKYKPVSIEAHMRFDKNRARHVADVETRKAANAKTFEAGEKFIKARQLAHDSGKDARIVAPKFITEHVIKRGR